MAGTEAVRPSAIWGLVLVLLLGSASFAEGSVLRGLTLSELQDGADAMVAGTVVGVRAVRSRGIVETVARVRVDRSWRGTASRVIEVRVPGGVRGGRRVIVPGAPSFREGEHVLMFLVRDGDQYRPVGLFQGVWRLDPEHPRQAHASDSGGAAVLRPAVGTAAVEATECTVQQLVGRSRGAR